MFFTYILPLLILVPAVVDDLRSQKIHNYLILILLALALISLVLVQGFGALVPALFRFLMALGIGIPLVLIKVFGGGDMKLYAVLSLVLFPQALMVSLVCAFCWGAFLGLIKVVLDKKIGLIYLNFKSLLKFKKPEQAHLHTFPFSVSMLVGWASSFYFVS